MSQEKYAVIKYEFRILCNNKIVILRLNKELQLINCGIIGLNNNFYVKYCEI